MPCGRLPTEMVAINCGVWPRRNTFTSLAPPTVTYANLPLRLFTRFTWLVIGPVSNKAFSPKGGCALKTCTLPTSFKVIHTSSFSGLMSMLGQKGLACGTRLIIWCVFASITDSSGVKLERHIGRRDQT